MTQRHARREAEPVLEQPPSSNKPHRSCDEKAIIVCESGYPSCQQDCRFDLFSRVLGRALGLFLAHPQKVRVIQVAEGVQRVREDSHIVIRC